MVGGDWLELLYRGASATSRIQRGVYELCLFTALRERLRCKRHLSPATSADSKPKRGVAGG